jgi:hypothetical protein
MIQRRSAWIDVSMPHRPEARLLGSFVSGGARLLSRTVPSFLSLPPCLSLHRFFLWPSSSYALALRFVRSGSSLPIRGGVLIIGSTTSLHTQL